ncbi:MAG: flavin reductase family protein [Planctomycetes bacterium]|nr:flavin reductase family protein [Planctomycetota bacterium]
MFYETCLNNHGLPRDPFKSCVVPRPIGWISTIDSNGKANLAPFSYFNAVSGLPPHVMFSPGGLGPEGKAKHSLLNAEATGEFVVNVVSRQLAEQMVQTSAAVAFDVDEFELAGLSKEPSKLVKPSRVAGAPIHLECKYWKTIQMPQDDGVPCHMVIGQVVGVHIADEIIDDDGLVDVLRFEPVARLGYRQYASINNVFEIQLPKA